MSDTTYLRLTVSDRVRELEAAGKGSRQFTIPHSSVLQILALGGLSENTQISKTNPLQLTCVTPKGTQFNLVQGDTHSLHYTHQSNDQAREFLNWAWDQEGAVKLEVTAVEATSIGQSTSTEDGTIDMDDCPF